MLSGGSSDLLWQVGNDHLGSVSTIDLMAIRIKGLVMEL